MLSDEEKKAVFQLKDLENDKEHLIIEQRQAITTILNLIEKQSKEIEGLKEDNKKKSIVIIEYQDLYEKLVDKIKAKIEEVDIQLQKLKDGLTGRKTNFVNKNMLFAQKKVLQSLLEKE